MSGTTNNSNSLTLYLLGDDSPFISILSQEMTARGLNLGSNSPVPTAFFPHQLVAWAVTDFINTADNILKTISSSTFSASKVMVIFPLDKPQSSPEKVAETNFKINNYLHQLNQLCRRKQIDFRSLGYLCLYGQNGVGEGTSLGAIANLVISGFIPKLDGQELYPISLDSVVKSVMGLWFNRGHKYQKILLRGSKLNSLQVNKLFSQSRAPFIQKPLSLWWGDGTGIQPDDIIEIASNPQDLINLFNHLSPKSPSPTIIPKKVNLPPVKSDLFISPPIKASPKPIITQPRSKKSFTPLKYLTITFISSFLAYFLVTYGFFAISLGQINRFKPETGDSIDQFQQRLTNANYRYQKLAFLKSTFPPFTTLNTYFDSRKTLIEKQLLVHQIEIDSQTALAMFLGAKEGSPHQRLSQIKLNLDKLYSLETQNQSSSEVIQQLADVRQILQLLPQLIPDNQKITVLILLQNNLELRPTGGFIGSVALITIDRGKILTLETRDIYDLDSNLRGVVTPPAEITQYLGETSWYFRDSNWNPDFTQAATSANWFLDKEWGSQADLIIGLNLNSLVKMITALGGITLTDGTSLNADNLFITGLNYQDTAAAAADKPEYLSTIIKTLNQKLTQVDPAIKFQTLKGLYQAIKSAEITISTPNKNLIPPLSDLYLSGTIYRPPCSYQLPEPCYSDHFYLNEANVGINKANYYLTRESAHQVNISDTHISHTHQLKLANSSPSDIWPAGPYKTYFRAHLPPTAGQIKIVIDGKALPTSDISVETTPAYRVVAWFAEVKPQASNIITLTYQLLNPQSLKSYHLFIQKQPGLLPSTLNYTLTSPVSSTTNTVDFTQHLSLNLNISF